MAYRVRIVQADGVERYLGRTTHGRYRRCLRDHARSTGYTTINGARSAARLYIGDGKWLGTYHADIQDDDNEGPGIDI